MDSSGHASPDPDRADDTEVAPPEQLLACFAAVAERWLARVVVDRGAALDPAARARLDDEARRTAESAAPQIVDQLAEVLRADVDEPVGNPLAVLRRAVVGPPTELLRRAGVEPAARDEFDARTFPDDVYGLGPATWSDVDESLHEPGIVWGAWKAATVLARRRAEGRR